MVRQASLFSQLLRQVPRSEFDHLVRRHGAEKGAKGFTCWTQFVAMLFCHLGRADSLREICHGLACCVGKLVHLGIGRAPKRSSLSYANAHRPADLFEDLFWHLADRLRSREGLGRRKRKFRFKNKLMSLDSTTISLCLSLFPWARFRRAKGGVKVHVLLDHDDYMPSYVLLTEARRHDRMGARLLRLNPGSIVAMDRAYNDYQLFADWTAAGIFFVTRLKDNADYEVIEERRVPKNSSILSDQDHPPRGQGGAEEVPRPPAPGGRVGRGQPAPDRAAEQPLGVRGHHDRRHLPGPLGDRAVLQDAEATSQGEDLRGHQRKRAAHPRSGRP